MRIGVVAEIWRYPCKSMGGERVQRTRIGEGGLPGDRGWAVRDDAAGEIRGAKKLPMLLQWQARYIEEPGEGGSPPIEITLGDGARLRSDDAGAAAALLAALGRDISLWPLRPASDTQHYLSAPPEAGADMMATIRAIMGMEEGDPFPDFSGLPPGMAGFSTPPGTYFDAYPLHLMTTASLREMRRLAPGADFDVRRFRPNVLIETDAGIEGLVEFGWLGKTVRIGGAEASIIATTVRCAMPMRAQAELPENRDIVRTLVRETGQHLGVYARVARAGDVAVGDAVVVRD